MSRLALALLATAGLAAPAQAALIPGEIAFTGYNADGDDDFALVVLVDVTDEAIYITDNESDGAGGLDGNGEGAILWETGATVIPAGTVVVFSDLSGTPSVTRGAITEPDAGFNLAAGGDSLLAFHGTDEHTPTLFLAGLESGDGAAGPLTGTGLVEGTTFVSVSAGAHDDGAVYSGPRATISGFGALLPYLHDPANWTTSASDGESLLPFVATPFAENVSRPEDVPFLGPFGLILLGAGLAGAGATTVSRDGASS